MKPMAARLKSVLSALALAATLPLGACAGFVPLYSQQGLAAGMSAISVETPQTRTGYLLREQLEDQLAIRKDAPAQYRLTVVIVETRRPRGLNADDTPTRYELRLRLTYTLTEVPGGRVVLKGSKPIFVSTDAVIQPYASIAAQQDAEQRAATEAATLIRTDVALALAGK
jgi:LPS-assembly lipoprotein